jgi:uncharacterized membrane protein YphA (DoxX/SURF4 family)
MNIALWIIAGLLAASFLGSGGSKIALPTDKLAAYGLKFVEDFSPAAIKAIGVAEILAAIGLILPAAFGIAPILVPVAAAGLVLLMLGAVITHVRRHEPQGLPMSLFLLVLAAIVTWERFGPHSFTS